MGPARTARERIREEVTREILAAARRHLARDGAAALSVRSIARDLEMAPSALYRYFDGRNALLSALILEAYTALAEDAERAAEAAAPASPRPGLDDVERWLAVPRAIRAWALARPHEWGLIFGSPVPGYQAPPDTVAPYARVVVALLRPLEDAHDAGRLPSIPRPVRGPATRGDVDLDVALAPVRDALLPTFSPRTVRVVQAWATLIGAISLELFGHWHNTVLDPELVFEEAMRETALSCGLRADRAP